jgi:hypothetical protein
MIADPFDRAREDMEYARRILLAQLCPECLQDTLDLACPVHGPEIISADSDHPCLGKGIIAVSLIMSTEMEVCV